MRTYPVVFPRCFLVLAALFCARCLAAVAVSPLVSGPYPVGSTNFEVNDVSSNSEMEQYLIGTYSPTERYAADILQCPADCPSVNVSFPNTASIFSLHAGKSVRYVAFILYPTTDDNTRPDYVFPYTNTGDHTFPHMQRSGEAPLLRDTKVRYPVIVYSHGYNAHGLWDLGHMKFLASQGYIVVAIQHGDGRNYFQSCLAERPLVVSRFLDYVLTHPVFGKAVDRERIGISGTSLGGYTTLASVGGGYYGSSLVPPDTRFHAAFGLVPWVGNPGGTPFGVDYAALANVKCPFFAVYAQNDTSVPKVTVESALPKIAGHCAGVLLMGETHSLTGPAYVEGQTYEVLFFNAWLRDDPQAMKTLYGEMNVKDGPDDRRTFLHVVTEPEADESVYFGDCPEESRLIERISGTKLRVVFPASTDTSIRYDVMGSYDLREWQCLRATQVEATSGADLDGWSPSSGFVWRSMEVEGSLADITRPLFLRLRVSR